MPIAIHRCPSRPGLRHALLPAATVAVVASALALVICSSPALAAPADDATLQRLATCQDSWLDWSEGHPRMKQYADFVRTRMQQQDDGATFVPKTAMTVAGLPIEQVFPQSVGMGVGFSAIVHADFAETRRGFEKQLGKPMSCKTSDGTPACELTIGDKKTAILMTDNPRSARTLVGCYYFYQQ